MYFENLKNRKMLLDQSLKYPPPLITGAITGHPFALTLVVLA